MIQEKGKLSNIGIVLKVGDAKLNFWRQ